MNELCCSGRRNKEGLHLELAKSQEERRTSLSQVSQSLSEISDKLDTAGKGWTPWTEVSSAKQQVADMQDIVDKQLSDAKQTQEDMQGQLEKEDLLLGPTSPGSVNTLRDEVLKSKQ